MAGIRGDLMEVYRSLLMEFGSQGWWPARRNFEPKEWEICAGAILAQSTNWRNVEAALDGLATAGVISPESVLKIPPSRLERLVRPSGFYRQKAVRLRTLARFVLSFGSFAEFSGRISREELLKVKGIGPETCDSILLYACGKPYFVIDAYTRRFVEARGMRTGEDYESLRAHFEKSLPKDAGIYKEFHALIVEWGKSRRKPRTKSNPC